METTNDTETQKLSWYVDVAKMAICKEELNAQMKKLAAQILDIDKLLRNALKGKPP